MCNELLEGHTQVDYIAAKQIRADYNSLKELVISIGMQQSTMVSDTIVGGNVFETCSHVHSSLALYAFATKI